MARQTLGFEDRSPDLIAEQIDDWLLAHPNYGIWGPISLAAAPFGGDHGTELGVVWGAIVTVSDGEDV